ncbi:MAG: XdhC family protein [Candidatus Hydrogenedentota bacterium]
MKNSVYFYRELNNIIEKGEDALLCTVIAISGSAPQVPGARMIVTYGGIVSGTIGGGCGENVVKTEAIRMLSTEETFKIFEVSLNDDLNQRDGDICGGRMAVLIEKICGH